MYCQKDQLGIACILLVISEQIDRKRQLNFSSMFFTNFICKALI